MKVRRSIMTWICLVALLVSMLPISAFAAEAQWNGSYTSAENNSTTTAPVPVQPEQIVKAWQAEVGTGTVAIVGDYIYTYDGYDFGGSISKGGTLYQIDAQTGEIVKQVKSTVASSNYYCYTIYAYGLIYVAGVNQVIAVDPDSLSVEWTAPVNPCHYPVVQAVKGCIVTNGQVLDAETGNLIATLEGSYNFSSGVERNGVFYVASVAGDLYAYDTENWTQLDVLNFRTANAWDKLQPGVMYYEGKLYWSDYYSGNLYSVELDQDGLFVQDSFLSENSGICSVCTPVAADGRVYLPGKLNNTGVVGVFQAEDLQLIYTAGTAAGNIMSTPILVDGAENTILVQSYGAENDGSKLYILQDTADAVEGALTMLVDIEPADYAYQQLAVDEEGALYCTNDAGYLIKYEKAQVPVPEFTKDLAETTVVYEQNAKAIALEVQASVTDGTLSYQWQSKTENGQWENISGATAASFTPATGAVGTVYYRCVASNTLYGEKAAIPSKAIAVKVLAPEPEKTTIEVTFRLIGDSVHEGAHEAYVTWIPTTTYEVENGATVYDVFAKAAQENGLDHKVENKNYVSSVQAPSVLGGFWLEQLANGSKSGWMFTVNGEHPSKAMNAYKLSDGDAVIWHYVDDFAVEEESNTWLEAEDISPEKYAETHKPVHTHTEVKLGIKEATWYAEGYTGDTYCSVCNVLIKKGTVTEKTKDQPENPFADVAEDKFYFTPVLWAVEEGVTAGTSATTFAPEANCTRGQIVTFMWRAAGEPEPSSAEHPFTDLDEKAFYYKAVLWAVENEITKGLTDTTFGPGKECTRGQVVTFLHRFAGNVAPESQDNPFTDVKENAFYYNAMLWAVEKDITKGISTTQFAPDKTCTRGQIVTFLFRYMTQK